MSRLQQRRKEQAYRDIVRYLIGKIEVDESGLSYMGNVIDKFKKHPRFADIFHEVMDETDRRNPEELWEKWEQGVESIK